MLLVAFKDCDLGILIQSPADRSVLNLRRLQVRIKTIPALVRDLLYADDCALLAHTLQDAQQLFDRFRTTAASFRLTVSPKKTEVIHQPVTKSTHSPPGVKPGDVTLKAVDHFYFCYLDSILSTDVTADIDTSAR